MTSYANVSSLEQREQRIRQSRRRQERALAVAKIAALEHHQHELRIRKQDSDYQYDSDGLYAENTSRRDRSRDSFPNDHLLDGQNSGHSETSSDYENLRVSLSSDYEICLGRLKAMQTTIEGALIKLSPTSAGRSTAGARRRLIKKVDDNGRQTLLCLQNHLVKSPSHHRILHAGNRNPRRQSAQRWTSQTFQSRQVSRPGTGKLYFPLRSVHL